MSLGIFLIFGDYLNEIARRERKECASVVKGLQHKLEILATKPCMVLKEKICIFIKILEISDIKNFQQKDCIFL